MVHRKTWEEFRATGLLLFTNSFLHMFGWAIVVDTDEEGKVTDCFVARTKFRGFDNVSVIEAHKKLAEYVAANAQELKDEANSDDDL